jgi:hypothetical protein
MNYTNALTTEQIQRYAPSAFASQPYHAQSSRYAFIPTSAVIDGMRQAGFVPVMASQSRTRIEDKKQFTKHMIRFRASGALQSQAIVGDSILEAVLINSHDGTSAYKLMCGVFRFVCSNGMVVADSLLESINVRHTGNVIEEVIRGSQNILNQAPRVMDRIAEWKTIDLAPAEQKLLVESAHGLRFPIDGETGNPNPTQITPDHMLSARRSDDRHSDLWHTFNRIQENATKGIKTYSNHHRVTSRAVKGIDGDVRLNRALWSLAEKMAELKRS